MGCLVILTAILGIFCPPVWLLTIALAICWAVTGGKPKEVHHHHHHGRLR